MISGVLIMPVLPSLSNLVAFDSTVRHGSITLASVELNLTQSAVSRQILQLEELLGVRLFERIRQRLIITDAGKLYWNDVSALLAQVHQSTQRIMGFGGSENVLNLAVLPTFATRWLIPRLPRFMKEHEELSINFSTRLEPFDFAAEPFDLAIHYGGPSWAGATTHHLMDEGIVAVCNPNLVSVNAIRNRRSILKQKLLHLISRPDAWMEWFRSVGIDCGALPGPRFEQFGMMTQATVAGLGLALIPKLLIDEELRSGKLVQLFEESQFTGKAYFLVVPDAKAGSRHVALFVNWLLASAQQERMPGTNGRPTKKALSSPVAVKARI
jgi:LysR family glycine cleavage system transcriptional activator